MTSRSCSHWILATCALAIVTLAPGRSSAQISQSNSLGQIRFDSGQNVVPVFEGWEKNPDGSFNMVFGYMNRNYEEEPEIPLGPNNNISPAPLDQGQPTHFYPRRQMFMFKVRVPADFGKKELVWTLTRNGRTEKAYATLMLEEELTEVVISENRGGLANDMVKSEPNQPPKISIDGPAERTVGVGQTVTLVTSATDDGVPKPPAPSSRGANRNAVVVDGVALVTNRARPTNQAVIPVSRQGLAVTWIVWRGPDSAAFEPRTAVVKDGKMTTNVSFTTPGTYVLRAYADDGVVNTPADVTVTVTETPRTSARP